MDVDLPEVHARALDHARRAIAGIGADQWEVVSDCDDWTVRELVNHVVTGNYWAAELGSGFTIEQVGDRLDGDVLGTDPLRAYDDSSLVAAAVFRAPGAMERPCAVSYGPVPGSVYCGHRFLDVLVHGWDVAVSTGQDTTLDVDLVEACLEVIEPQIDMLVSSGAFGTRLDVPEGSSSQTKLLGLLGRRDADGGV
ncbi:MAG TPA: TIGR03086 family metal-binding protein [Acidimicrobiia bacterium]|nr:TIGR03086 family metal-binding protein [Acidimicrobiia bacterium]